MEEELYKVKIKLVPKKQLKYGWKNQKKKIINNDYIYRLLFK